MPARRRNVGGDAVGFLHGVCHRKSGECPTGAVVGRRHGVDPHSVGCARREHRGEGIVRKVLRALGLHLAFDLRVIPGEHCGGAEGLGRAQGGPHGAVCARGEATDHPRVAVGGNPREVVPNHRWNLVRGPREDRGASAKIRAIVLVLVDVQGGGDDDRRRDDPGIDRVVEGLLDAEVLQDAVGSAGVAVEELDDTVGLAVARRVVAGDDDVHGLSDPARGSRPRGREHAVVAALEGGVEFGFLEGLALGFGLRTCGLLRAQQRGRSEATEVPAGLDDAERTVENQSSSRSDEQRGNQDDGGSAEPSPCATRATRGGQARKEECSREQGDER